MKKLNKKWIIAVVILAILIAGHFMPVARAVVEHPFSGCGGGNYRYRLILGKRASYYNDQTNDKEMSGMCDAPSDKNHYSLYLW